MMHDQIRLQSYTVALILIHGIIRFFIRTLTFRDLQGLQIKVLIGTYEFRQPQSTLSLACYSPE